MRDEEIGNSKAALRDALQEVQGEMGNMLAYLDYGKYHQVRASYIELQQAWGIIGAESAYLHETHPRTQEVIRKELGLPRRP